MQLRCVHGAASATVQCTMVLSSSIAVVADADFARAAGVFRRQVAAAREVLAHIDCAGVAVITVGRAARGALARLAGVVICAFVTIIARVPIVRVRATCWQGATVCCAWVVVVADLRLADTGAVGAAVVY